MKPIARTSSTSRAQPGALGLSSTLRSGSKDTARACSQTSAGAPRGGSQTPWTIDSYLSGVLPTDDKREMIDDSRGRHTKERLTSVAGPGVETVPQGRHRPISRSGLHVVKGSVNIFLAGEGLKDKGLVVIGRSGDARAKSVAPTRRDLPVDGGSDNEIVKDEQILSRLDGCELLEKSADINKSLNSKDKRLGVEHHISNTVLLDSYLSRTLKKNCSQRGGTKRRKTYKELETFNRNMRAMEKRYEVSSEWMPISSESAAPFSDATEVPSIQGLVPDPLMDVINNTTPIPPGDASLSSPASVLTSSNITSCSVTSSPSVTSHCSKSSGYSSKHSNNSFNCSASISSSDAYASCASTPPSTPDRSHPVKDESLRKGGRRNSLPEFSWADSDEVWKRMVEKEEMAEYRRDEDWCLRHPELTPRMRSVLLDWIMEVAEAYRLKRDTFHACVDLLDRYLCRSRDQPKSRLQLIGVTVLYIASKIEETVPLKTSEVASVTDGSCSEKEILNLERDILTTLDWNLSPLTTTSWISLFLQSLSVTDPLDRFLTPQYSQYNFVELSRLIDLCVLDQTSLRFSYSKLAAAAMYHMFSHQAAILVSGFEVKDLAECRNWMSDHVRVLRQQPNSNVQYFRRIPRSESHHIQTHTVSVELLDLCQNKDSQLPQTRTSTVPDLYQPVTSDDSHLLQYSLHNDFSKL